MCKILEQYPDLAPWLSQQLNEGAEYVEIFATASEMAARSPCPSIPSESLLHILLCHTGQDLQEYMCEHDWPALSYKLFEFVTENACKALLGNMSLLEYRQGKKTIIQNWMQGEHSSEKV